MKSTAPRAAPFPSPSIVRNGPYTVAIATAARCRTVTAVCRRSAVAVLRSIAGGSPPSIVVFLPLFVVGCAAMGSQPGTSPAPRPRRFTPELSSWTSSLQHPLLQAVPVDPEDGFDPDEVALLAVVTNPNLRTLRDSRGVAHAQVIAAGLLPNPVISFQPYIPVAGKTTGSVVGYTGQLAWSLSKLLWRRPQIDAAQFAQQRVELDIAWSEWSVAMRAQLLAYQMILLKHAQRIHRANIVELEEALAHIRHAASVGSATTAQLASTEAVLTQAQTASAITNRDLAVRAAEITGMLGGIDGVVGHLTGDLVPPQDLASLTRDSLTTDLADRRPDLQALRMGMRSQDAAFQAATRRAFPSLQLGFQVARDPGDFLAIGPTIQVGFPVFDRGQAGRAAAQAQSARLADLFAERSNEARQRIGVAIAEARGGAATLAVVDRAILRQAKVVDLYEAARARGSADILVYYAARTTLVQLRLQRVRERMRFWQALVQLRSESGYYRLPSVRGGERGDRDAR